MTVSAQGPKEIYREYAKNEKGQPTEVVTYRGENDEHLQRLRKTSYAYEGDNVIQKVVYSWDELENKWVQQSKIAYAYGVNEHLLSATLQVWDDMSSDWSKSKEYMQYVGYNAVKLLAAE